MDRRLNPYAPGAGLQPPELAGRDALIAEATIDMERLFAGRPTKGMMLLGLRGVGKTVLLNRLLRIADDKGFATAKIEAPEYGTLPQLLLPELRRILHQLDLRYAAGQRIRRAWSVMRNFASSFKLTVGDLTFGIEPAPGEADTGALQQDLPTLLVAIAEAAKERQTAIGLFIDEVQYLSIDELSAIIVASHEIAQRNLPLIVIGAGLPQIPALAGNAKSYAERLFTYPQVDQLDPDAARRALVSPAQRQGVHFEPAAIEAILAVTQRYPYFLQEWGFHVWNTASVPPFQLRHIDQATPGIIAHLDANFFRVRFDRLTLLQQRYLRAMAELGPGPHRTGEIATTLGVGAAAVATVRQHLIEKGMVWSQRVGETAFTVPLFDEFMKRQMPVLEQHVPKPRRRPGGHAPPPD